MDNGLGKVGSTSTEDMTVAQLLGRYSREIAAKKKGAETEQLRLERMQLAPFAKLRVSKLTSSAIADFRDQRLAQVKPTTVRRELGIIRSALETARREWGAPMRENPVSQITIPAAKDARERRLTNDESRTLFASIDQCRNRTLKPLVMFALETGLRRGELLRLNWCDIDLEGRRALIRNTKNGRDRMIPLSKSAISVLTSIRLGGPNPFPISANALRQSWKRICLRAGISDLRFHDLRHEAISRFFELGLSVPEVALISGHRDARMLFRYTHLSADVVRERMDGLTAK